ncbi:MAG: hypothetical protein DRO08_01315 [Thermoprotei archaeon]|nr:MAG: hypothetical protein DRO08_01315 [Thermoprotei archaeon]
MVKYPLIPSYVLADAETCARCCLCTLVCPIYEHTKDPSKTPPYYSKMLVKIANTRYAYIPRGKLSNILKEAINVYYCTLCGACITMCPFGILTPDIVLTVRENVYRIFRDAVPKPIIEVVKSLKEYGNPYKRKISLKSLKEKLCHGSASKKKSTLLYPGCTLSLFSWKTVENAAKLLLKAGISIEIPAEVKCCGFPALVSGDHKLFVDTVKENVNEWSKYDEVVFLCSECYKTFLEHYGEGESKVNASYIVDYLLKLIDEGVLKPSTKYVGEKVVIHDPCNYGRWLGRSNILEELLRKLQIPYVKPKLHGKYTYCCGFGGLLAFIDSKLALAISHRRLESLVKESTTIVSICPACVLSAGRSLKIGRIKAKALNIIDLAYEILK